MIFRRSLVHRGKIAMTWRLALGSYQPRVAIFVSKYEPLPRGPSVSSEEWQLACENSADHQATTRMRRTPRRFLPHFRTTSFPAQKKVNPKLSSRNSRCCAKNNHRT